VDTGDLLFSNESVQNPNAKQIGNLKADLYMKSYNLMGYNAFTPGELDLSIGVGELIKMSQQANFPFLAANLIKADSKEPVFKSYIIKQVQRIRVGIFGLISDQFPLEGPPEEKGKFVITDPIETAKKIVGTLKKRCRVIVVLAHMGAEEQKKLATNVHGIHFVINGHLSHAHQDPQLVGPTQILIAGSRGEHLGQVDLFKQKRKLLSRYQLKPLKTDYKEKPEVLTWVGQYKDEMQCVVQPAVVVAERPKGSTDSSTPISVPELVSFVGEKGCQTCHPREHEQWATTAHARAYQTLVAKNKTSDPSCLPCHTTGFGAPREAGGRFENVQCEACHGPAEGHPDPRKELEDAEEHECRACHNASNSPNFNYDIYVQKIIHPK
jgi:2',3'-cyclic-nucleotide 2'-phosphodiesterase (5'-nucleotidase family)